MRKYGKRRNLRFREFFVLQLSGNHVVRRTPRRSVAWQRLRSLRGVPAEKPSETVAPPTPTHRRLGGRAGIGESPAAEAAFMGAGFFRWTEVQLPPAEAGGSHLRQGYGGQAHQQLFSWKFQQFSEAGKDRGVTEKGRVRGGAEKMAGTPTLPILQNREGSGSRGKTWEKAALPAESTSARTSARAGMRVS